MEYDGTHVLSQMVLCTGSLLLSYQFHDHSDVLLLFSQSWMTALMLASEGGHLDVVRELLKAQADVNALDWVCSLQ